MGLKVNLPASFAVESPSFSANQPWLYSWIMMAINKDKIKKNLFNTQKIIYIPTVT